MRIGVRRTWFSASCVLLAGCSLAHERSLEAVPLEDAAVSGDAFLPTDAAVAVPEDARIDLEHLRGLCGSVEVTADPFTHLLPCKIHVPGVTVHELKNYVNVVFTPQVGEPERAFGAVRDASACGERTNAYFVGDAEPAHLYACPAACTQWRASPEGRVTVYLACIDPLIE